MRWCIAALLLAAPLAPGADERHTHATFYTANHAGQETIEAAPEWGASPVPAPGSARLMEDGRPGNVAPSWKEFRATPYGITAVLAVDTSGSVQGTPFDSVKAALKNFVSSSRAQDRIAIVGFADSVNIGQTFTADKAQLTRAIDGLHTGGRQTLLNGAIARSLSLLAGEPTNPRRHLLVITDGKNEGPGPSLQQLTEDAREAGIPVDCIGVTRLSAKYLEPLQALALATGGAYIRARGYDQLRQAMSQGIEGLLGSPVLTFHLAHVLYDGQRHSFQVTAQGVSTDTASVLLPAPPASALLLYSSIGAAVLLFGVGMMLIYYSRKRTPVEAAAALPAPPTREIPPRQARVATVYERHEASASSGTESPARARQAAAHAGSGPPGPVTSARSETAPLTGPTEFRPVFQAPAPESPTAWMRLISQPGATAPLPALRYPIDANDVWIGAGSANQICVRHDTAVSRVHARIQWSGGDLYLLDNHSTNGTTVNARAVQAGSRVRLQPGDRIAIGESVFSLDPPDRPFS